MENSPVLRKTKLLIRIVAICIILLGFVFPIPYLMELASSNQITLNCTLPISFLMIIGGGLLLVLHKGALDIIFIVLRFFILSGLIFVVIGLLSQQFIAILPLIAVAIAAGLMRFLSRDDVKSALRKKDDVQYGKD